MNMLPRSAQEQRSQKPGAWQPDISMLNTQKMVASNRPSGNISSPQLKKRRVNRFFLLILILLLICLSGAGASFVGYHTYRSDMAQAQIGIHDLQTALSLMQSLSKEPFNTATITQAQHEFVAASAIFGQLNAQVQWLPSGLSAIPVYGTRVSAAQHLLPLALEVSQAGIIGCNILTLIVQRFHDPFHAGQGLTLADLSVLDKDIQQLEIIFTQAVSQANALTPGDIQFEPRLGKAVAALHKYLPTARAVLGQMHQLLPVLPQLLGIGTKTNYLIELMDSTELRPGGGFIGNYGFATLSGGRLMDAHITDTYLLDNPFVDAGHSLPYPPAYQWFDLNPTSWSLRDSNLDADFPTAARYAEQNYSREGGTVPVQGVIAITPAFIEQALEITGPISVPEYQQTVTAQNLVSLIHYYQVGPGYQGGDIPSPDGHSSVNKRFTELLAEHFLARLQQMPASTLPRLFHLLLNGLQTKDMQIYFNAAPAENLLSLFHVASTIQAPAGDSLFVVDANIAGDKANQYITSTLHDQVTIDNVGSVMHHTTLTYTWSGDGPVYGSGLYRDYVRVYVPPESVLQSQQGWQVRGTSTAFGREVWAGFFTLTYGQVQTITLTWVEKGTAKKTTTSWHYQYLIQHQAGTQWQVNIQLMLPSCAKNMQTSGGLTAQNKQGADFVQILTQDTGLSVDYNC